VLFPKVCERCKLCQQNSPATPENFAACLTNFDFNDKNRPVGFCVPTHTAEIFDRIMSINVRSVFFGMKHQIPALLKSGGGAIVNNASILGLRPAAGSPIYSASKAAVLYLCSPNAAFTTGVTLPLDGAFAA
jgi:hypothetical protein